VGQRHAPAADAALILSMEAVFAAISGFMFLGERFTWVQTTGVF
jgi:drug/metabolite transporter (DMT)-like permease